MLNVSKKNSIDTLFEADRSLLASRKDIAILVNPDTTGQVFCTTLNIDICTVWCGGLDSVRRFGQDTWITEYLFINGSHLRVYKTKTYSQIECALRGRYLDNIIIHSLPIEISLLDALKVILPSLKYE